MTTSFRNRMKGKMDVWWEKTYSVRNILNVPYEKRLENFVSIPFRNRMKGKFDIIAPERKTVGLPPIEDTFISENNPYMIFGYGNNILVGYNNKKYEGLLKFNLQEIFPSFNKDSIIILDAQLKLTIENTRDVENNIINFYEGFSEWKESSTTWNNKPIRSNDIVTTYNINKDEINLNNSTVYIDIKETVLKWLDNPRKNNGIILEMNNNNDNIISFFSKEVENNEIIPTLVMTYIDLNSPFVIKNDYLHSFVHVWENKINSISSELEVVTKHSTSTIPSQMLVLNKPGDLLASLEVTRDRVLSELDLVGNHINCDLEVFTKNVNAIKNKLNVNGINIENEIKVSYSSELFNTLKTQYGKYLKGFLGINANRLVNEIDIHSWDNILNFLSVHEYWKIQNQLSMSYGNSITNELFVPPLSHLKNKLDILAQKSIKGDIFYGRFFDLLGYLTITPQSNLIGEILFMYENSIKNIANILAIKQIFNNIRYSSVKELTNYFSSSNMNYMQNILTIVGDFLKSEITIQDLDNISSKLIVQGRNINGNIHTSSQNKIKNIINILSKSELINELKIINEHIENSIIVYIKETKYCQGKIHALAVKNIIANLMYQYGNNIENKIDIYVDMISVLNSYIEIINEDEKYNQKKNYGYIM